MSAEPHFSAVFGKDILVFDGAMGTELYRHHVFTNRCFDELCLCEPDLIRRIHADYRDAGADVLTTNTFGANLPELSKFGLGERLREINVVGAALAREVADAAARPVFVAGSIGPISRGPDGGPDIPEMLADQIHALIEGGADFIFFETQPTRESLEHCVHAMQAASDFPFLLSFAIVGNAETVAGEPISRMMAPFSEGSPSPAGWGLNCGTGPDGLLGAVERMSRLTSLPWVVQPNAGIPREVGNRRIYLCSPEYLVTYALRFIRLGASGVGGCCGTNPDHIREIAAAVKPLAKAQIRPTVVAPAEAVPEREPIPLESRSRFGRMLAEGRWATSVELLPPRGYDLSGILEKTRMLYNRGVSAVNIPDGPRASSRISPLIAAEHIWRASHIEPILHFCSRDRNLIGMQADLLACAACHVQNILFVTGDPPKLGNYPQATGVFDTDSIGMVEIQARLNRGIDLGGRALDAPTSAVIGVGLDPTALDRRRELDRFRRKVEAGAEFAITQPVFDPDALLKMLDEIESLGIQPIPIIAGIWPLASLRNATFMQNEVPGVEIPDEIMRRMGSVDSREDQLKMGIEIAREAVERVRARVAGIQVSAPFGNVLTALGVIEA